MNARKPAKRVHDPLPRSFGKLALLFLPGLQLYKIQKEKFSHQQLIAYSLTVDKSRYFKREVKANHFVMHDKANTR